jgi:hypothetical protein
MRLQEKVEEDLRQNPPLLVQPPVEEPQPTPSAVAATGRRASFSSDGSDATGAGHAGGSRRRGEGRADLGPCASQLLPRAHLVV